MKWVWVMMLNIVLIFGMLAGCEAPLNYEDSRSEQSFLLEMKSNQPWAGLKATGEFSALWEGCQDDGNDGENGHDGGHDDGDCGGDHEANDIWAEADDGNCGDDHDDGGHDDEGCSGNRPARDFYVQFDTQLKKTVKGNVNFLGLGEYEGIDFSGAVTWIETGREENELFFGGEVTDGTVTRNCFLFSLQDNGQGKKAEADRLQYRLYKSSTSQCDEPDHLPKGYPIAVYQGNLTVH